MNKKIQFKDNEGNVYPKTFSNYIQVNCNQNIKQIGSEYSIIQKYDTVTYNKGNGFALENGFVKVISDNIKAVKITTVTWIERGYGIYARIYNVVNGIDTGNSIIPSINSGDGWHGITLISTATNIKKGDYIYPNIYFNGTSEYNMTAGGNYPNTVYMIVEDIT